MSDPRVEAAIAHWAPRFIAQGIDYNDFVRTTERIRGWADWCTEWQRTAAEHEALARAAEARNSPLSAADAWVQAAMCHHFGKFVFFDDMDQLRSASAATAADFARAAPLLDPPAEPVRIPYAGTFLPGYVTRSADCSYAAAWPRWHSTGRARARWSSSCRSNRHSKGRLRLCLTGWRAELTWIRRTSPPPE